MIDVNYNEYKETIAQNMKLIVENHDLKQEIEKLNKEVEKYKKRCLTGLRLIRDNYGVLDKYGIDILDDILNGVDKE